MKKTILNQLEGIELIENNKKRITDIITLYLRSNGYSIDFEIKLDKKEGLVIFVKGNGRAISIKSFSEIYKPIVGANKVTVKKSDNIYYQPGYRERMQFNNANILTLEKGKDIHPAELERNKKRFKPIKEI